jgi:hypothetical protein
MLAPDMAERASCREYATPDDGVVSDEIDREDLRAIILALMRIDEKLDELLGYDEEDDDGEEEDLS